MKFNNLFLFALCFSSLSPCFAGDKRETLRLIEASIDFRRYTYIPLSCLGKFANPEIEINYQPLLFTLSPKNWLGSDKEEVIPETGVGVARAHEKALKTTYSNLEPWSFAPMDVELIFHNHPGFSNAYITTERYVVIDKIEERGRAWLAPKEIYLTYNRDTGIPNSTYRAGLVDESQKRFSPAERTVVEVLAAEGHFVVSEKEKGGGVKNPEGVLKFEDPATGNSEQFPIEIKTLQPESGALQAQRAIWKSLMKNGQAPYIIVDARRTEMTYVDSPLAIKSLLEQFWNHWRSGYQRKLREVRILGKDFDHTYVFFTLEEIIKR